MLKNFIEQKTITLFYTDNENDNYYETSIYNDVNDFLNYYISFHKHHKQYNNKNELIFDFDDFIRILKLFNMIENFNDNIKYIHWIDDDLIIVVINNDNIFEFDLWNCELQKIDYYNVIDFINTWEYTTICI